MGKRGNHTSIKIYKVYVHELWTRQDSCGWICHEAAYLTGRLPGSAGVGATVTTSDERQYQRRRFLISHSKPKPTTRPANDRNWMLHLLMSMQCMPPWSSRLKASSFKSTTSSYNVTIPKYDLPLRFWAWALPHSGCWCLPPNTSLAFNIRMSLLCSLCARLRS